MPSNESQSNYTTDAPPPPEWVERLVSAAGARVVGDPPGVTVAILRHVVYRTTTTYEIVTRIADFTPEAVRLALTTTPGACGVVLDFGPARPGVRLVARGAAIERAILPARR